MVSDRQGGPLLEPVRRPLKIRLLNAFDRGLRGLGARRQSFVPEELKAAAAARVGLSDFGPDDFEEGLAVACNAAEEAGLDIVGRAVAEAGLRRILGNRLLWVDYKQRNPAVFQAPLTPPLIVVGLPRTGTTALHRLLSCDPAAHAPPTWQVWRPLPVPGKPDKRREITQRAIEGLRQLAPQLDKKHYLDADATEECWHLLDPSFRGPGPYTLFPADRYYAWLAGQDVGPSYAMYRDFLQIFQSENPALRLTMKAPAHAQHVADLKTAVPEALLVQTHRDPVELAGSMISLAYTMMGTTKPDIDPIHIGRLSLRLLKDYQQGNLEQRAQLTDRIVDVRFTEFVSDPVATVRRVYEEHRLPFDAQVEAVMRDGVANRPRNKHGKHSWNLDDYGVTEAEIRDLFAEYEARFLMP